MRTIRIYQSGDYKVGDTVLLNRDAGHHVATVLRMREGSNLSLFPGNNREFDALVLSVRKNQVMVQITEERSLSRESPKKIHLVQGVSKGDKMEFVVQKAVELGVTSISPIISKHCAVKWDDERSKKKTMQWQAIAIAACEQSGRNVVPTIYPLQSLSEYMQCENNYVHFVLNPEANKSWRDYRFDMPEIALFIGPEGGLSKEELGLLAKKGYHSLSLGPRVLRTETAALAALALLQTVCGDL